MVCAARFARYAQTTPILRYAQERALRVKPMLDGRAYARAKEMIHSESL